MKFIVDEMPESEKKCPFSKWNSYPPFMEELGYYSCTLFGVNEVCVLESNNGYCNHMKVMKE